MCKRYNERPSVLLRVDEPYAAYCIDEACSYALCKIEESGRIPAQFEKSIAGTGYNTAMKYKNMKGVDFIDHRRYSGGLSDA